MKPEDYNLSSGYLYASNPWGDSFYKIYEKMNYTAAEAQCRSDGTFLAVPRFEEENNFIADLSTAETWIGVNDLQEEGKYVTAEGDLSYTNWGNWQPDNKLHSNGYDEDAVTVNSRSSKHGYWNDVPFVNLYPFVCLYRTTQSTTSAPGAIIIENTKTSMDRNEFRGNKK